MDSRQEQALPRPVPSFRYGAWFLASLALLALVATLPFMTRGWLPLDDGIYGWYARQMVEGAVLRQDLLISQPGYIAYLNALTYRWLGADLLALRYPMPLLVAAMTLAGVGLLRFHDRPSAVAVLAVVLGLGFPQFSVPSPSWYCLALALAFACLLVPASDPAQQGSRALLMRIFAAGMVAGLCVGVRQLSGGLLVIAGLCVLAQAHRRPSAELRARVAQGLGTTAWVASSALLLLYLYLSRSLSGFYWALPALATLALVAHGLLNRRHAFGPTAPLLFIAGCALGFMPLVLINLANGTLPDFLYQISIGASGYAEYGDARNQSFQLILLDAIELLSSPSGWLSVGSGVFLLLLLATPAGLLLGLWRHARDGSAIDPVLVCASLFSVTTVYFQSYLYLFYAMPLTVLALIRCFAGTVPRRQQRAAALATTIALFALLAFGGRVSGEVLGNLWRGSATAQVRCELPRCPLWVAPAAQGEMAAGLAELGQVPAQRPLLVLPHGAPYYLMLPNPTPWRWSSLNPAAASSTEQALLIRQLEAYPDTVIAVSTARRDIEKIPPQLWSVLCSDDLGESSLFSIHRPCGGSGIANTPGTTPARPRESPSPP